MHNMKHSIETKDKIRKKALGRKMSEETKRKMSESHKGKKVSKETKEKMINEGKGMYGKKHSIETKIKMSKSMKGKNKGKKRNNESRKKLSLTNRNTIEYIKNKYSLFSKIEEMRYNPEYKGEIQVHCKNHNCPNSKERGGWFTSSFGQISERIRQVQHLEGNGGSYFYCCDKCKQECPLYNLQTDPLQKSEILYTQIEYQTFREFVLKRDDYKCQYCGEKAEHVHHERPQKLEPFFALDPDLAWSVCKKCHYKYGHKDECSTGNLAKLICNKNKQM